MKTPQKSPLKRATASALGRSTCIVLFLGLGLYVPTALSFGSVATANDEQSTFYEELAASPDLGDGWYESDWLGPVYADEYPWLYAGTLGWICWVEDAEPDGIWFYKAESQFGYAYTGSHLYPHMYYGDTPGWLYHLDGPDPVSFYDCVLSTERTLRDVVGVVSFEVSELEAVYTAPYLLEFRFRLLDQNGLPVTLNPAEFSIEPMEGDRVVDLPDSGFQWIRTDEEGGYLLRWATLRRDSSEVFVPSFRIIRNRHTLEVDDLLEYDPENHAGDVRNGQLALVPDAIIDGSAVTTVRTSYVPGDIRSIRLHFQAAAGVQLAFERMDESDNVVIPADWSLEVLEQGDGLYEVTLSSPEPQDIGTSLPYASFGSLFRVIAENVTQEESPFFELSIDNSIYEPVDKRVRNILLFGNSYTIGANSQATNNTNFGVPSLIRRIAVAAGRPAPRTEGPTKGGKTLNWDLVNNTAIISNPTQFTAPSGFQWDYVVFQDFSTRPVEAANIGDIPAFRMDAVNLYERVQEHSAGVIPVFYQTWARHPDANQFYRDNYRTYWTSGQTSHPAAAAVMQAELSHAYDLARGDIDSIYGVGTARIAPVGDIFQAANWTGMYYTDHSHLVNSGYFLSALILYRTIYQDNVSDIDLNTATFNLPLAEINRLKTVADSASIVPEPEVDESQPFWTLAE